jgi:hypothetical protein
MAGEQTTLLQRIERNETTVEDAQLVEELLEIINDYDWHIRHLVSVVQAFINHKSYPETFEGGTMAGIGEIIEAMLIFKKYDPPDYPTGCAHDVLYVFVDPLEVSERDKERLDDLGFFVDSDGDCFASFRYGSG